MFERQLKIANEFKLEADRILGQHETSVSRVIELDATYRRLQRLSLNQDELFRESLRSVELGLYRSAHVLAWAGFMDLIEERLSLRRFGKLRKQRPNWVLRSVDDLRENYPEFQILEAARDVGLFSKGQAKTMLGLLSKRNECAHPTNYFPGMNESLGFISELLGRIQSIQKTR